MLYTRKINPIFSDIQNRIFDFEFAALDMMNFEWSYMFSSTRINVPFVLSLIFLGDIGETKLICGATFKKSYLRLSARNPNFETWVGTALVSTQFGERQTPLVCIPACGIKGSWSRG